MSYITTNSEEGNSLRNQNGTAERLCHCDSWLRHWKRYTETVATPSCAVAGCNELAIVGAHVELHKVEAQKGKSYIAPMCAAHNNQRGAELQSKPLVKLARANVSETCGLS